MIYEQHNIVTDMEKPERLHIIKDIVGIVKNSMKMVGGAIRVIETKIADTLGYIAPNGDRQLSCINKGLHKLAKKGLIDSDIFEKKNQNLSAKDSITCLPPARIPKNEVDEEITLSVVQTSEELAYFNEIVNSTSKSDHKNRDQLIGRQVKYLAYSGDDIVGAIGFDSAMLNSAKRDKSLNIELEYKKKYLHYFLNLRIIAMRSGWNDYRKKAIQNAIYHISDDFEKHYNYKPLLLETTIDQNDSLVDDFYSMNWELCGAGRVFSSIKVNNKLSKKKKIYSENYDVNINGADAIKEPLTFIYKLDSDKFNDIFKIQKSDYISLTDYLSSNDWAAIECKDAPFDKRAIRTLTDILVAKSNEPGKAFSALCSGNVNLINRFHRFLASDNQRITMDSILESSFKNTSLRCKDLEKVGWATDWSDLNLSGSNCEDLGVVGTDHRVAGYRLTPTMGVTENGEVAGLLKVTCESPIRRKKDDPINYQKTPIEEKNDYLWLAHLEAIDSESRSHPNRIDMAIFDRGGDIAEIFLERDKRFSSTHLIIRAKSDRTINGEETYNGESKKIFDFLRESKPAGEMVISTSDKSSSKNKKKKYRKKCGKKKCLSHGNKRRAILRIHYAEVKVKVPSYLIPKYGVDTIKLNAVLAREFNPPRGQERIEWLIWTTLPINSLTDAVDIVKWYSRRWTIEEFFRVLKTVCKVESIRFKTGIRMKRAIAIIALVAWRSMNLLSFAHTHPNLPASILFNNIELYFLDRLAKDLNYKPPINCEDAVILVCMLGGYIPGKGRRRPGYQVFNAGYEKFKCIIYYMTYYSIPEEILEKRDIE